MKASTKIIFYLSFESSKHRYVQVYVMLNNDRSQKFQLQKLDCDQYIYKTEIYLSQLISNKIYNYAYYVESDGIYQSDNFVNKVFNKNTMNEIEEVFDAPNKFILKQQENKEQRQIENEKNDIFIFIQNNTKVSTLLNFHQQLLLNSIKQEDKFFENSSKVVQLQLKNAHSYCEKFDQIIKYSEQLIRKNHIKIDFILIIINYYQKFMDSVENKQDVEKQIKDIFEKIPQKFEDRLKILENQNIFTEIEAEKYIDYEKYENYFEQQLTKTQDLLINFSNQKYKKITHQLRCKIVDGIISSSSISKFKDLNLFGFEQIRINSFKQIILKKKIGNNESLSDVFNTISKLQVSLNINQFEMRKFIQQQLEKQTNIQLDSQIIYDCAMKYEINISNYMSLLTSFIKCLIVDNECNRFLESILSQNPFVQLTKILYELIQKTVQQYQEQRISNQNSDQNSLDLSKLFNFKYKFFKFLEDLIPQQQIKMEQKIKLFEQKNIYIENLKKQYTQDCETLKQELVFQDEYKSYLEEIKQIILDEKQITEFNDKIISIIKTYMNNLGLRNLYNIQISNQIQIQGEFKGYFNELIQNYQKELQNEQVEKEFYEDYEFFLNNKNHTEEKQKILQTFEKIAQQRLNQLIEDQNVLFNSNFVSQFLTKCNQNSEFYKILQKKVDKITLKIEQLDFNRTELKQLCNQKHVDQIFQEFKKDNKQIFQNAKEIIQRIEGEIKILESFFTQFKEYFPVQHSNINKFNLKNQKIKVLKEEIEKLIAYYKFATTFFKLMESKIMQKVFLKLLNNNKNDLFQEINQDNNQQQYKISEKYFSSLINKFKNNISNLYNYIFENQEINIFNILINELQQIDIEQSKPYLFSKVYSNIKKTEIFQKEISFQDLEEFCENGTTHQNLSQLCEILKMQQNAKLNLIKVWNCIFQTQNQNSNLILDAAKIFNTDQKSIQNEFLFEFINEYEGVSLQKNKNLKTPNSPFYELFKVELSSKVQEAYQQLYDLSNIQTNLSNFKQSQVLISKVKQNIQNNTSFYDLRQFIGRDQHDLSVYLSSLHNLVPFLSKLQQEQDEIKGNNGYILDDIKRLNQFIEKNKDQTNEWTSIVNNIGKLEKIQSGLEKKKIYFDLLNNFWINSEIEIKTPLNGQPSTFTITCNNKIYLEQEIKEINLRVLIDKKSLNYILKNKDKQNIQNIQQSQNLTQNDINQERIRKFNQQLLLVDEILQRLQWISDFGYFLYTEETYLFQNSNHQCKQTIKQMKQLKENLENQKYQWEQNIKEVIQNFPKFSLISCPHYLQLDQYFRREILPNKLSKSLLQIMQQINPKNLENLEINKTIFVNYQQSKNKLEYMAEFITGQQRKQKGGMININKVKLIKCQNSLDAIEKIFSCEKNIENYKSEYFLFFDKHSNFQDLQLFLYRYMELELENKFINFYLVINCKLNGDYKSLFSDLKIRNSINFLYILVQENFYDSSLSLFPVLDIQKTNDLPLKEVFNSAIFYISKVPGVGKTQQIIQDYKSRNVKQSLIRIPSNGSSSKEDFIKQFQQNIGDSQSEMNQYHLDLYETDEIDLNFLLFEMIILKSINFNQREFLNLGSQAQFYIEVSNTINKSLENKIQIKKYFQIKDIEFKIDDISAGILAQNGLADKALIVYRYLNGISNVFEKKSDNYFDQSSNVQEMEAIKKYDNKEFARLLNEYFIKHIASCKVIPNFQQVLNFINLFGNEMIMLEKSVYVSLEYTKDSKTLRTDIVKFSFQMCQKISMSCLQDYSNIDCNSQTIEQILSQQTQQLLKFDELKISFVTFQEQEQPCLTFFFQNQKEIPQTFKKIFDSYQKKRFYSLLKKQYDDISYQDKTILLFNKDINTIQQNSGKQDKQKFEKEFSNMIIQQDNFFKISTTYLRIRSNIPIIFMGETGIGKTALIKYLTYLIDGIFESKTIHAGATEKEIIKLVEELEKKAQQNLNKKIILFFDEANTNSLISGLFKEIIVDRHIKGRKLHKNIVPIAAINPYKLKTEQQKQIFNFQIQGGIKSEMDKKFQGTDLEYNVFPIPQSMFNFVLNFGELNKNDEDSYIANIMQSLFKELETYTYQIDQKSKQNIIKMVCFSQEFIRKEMGNSTSACSLRDVQRFVDFVKNSFEFLNKASNNSEEKIDVNEKNIIPCSFYLTFYINYCLLIPENEKRVQYLEDLCKTYNKLNFKQLQDFIQKVEDFFILQLDLPKNIAKSSSLKQNAFLLFFCIVNRIPVCLIGPPGSSKSLALKCLITSMQGKQSKKAFFRFYAALIPICYQGHTQSKSNRIIEVFQDAEKRQEEFDLREKGQTENLSLICFDEIGLAEISPHNPLKVLHEYLERRKVAFVSISNWPLDASKMNRMLRVYRLDMGLNELEDILENMIPDQNRNHYFFNLVKNKIPQIYMNYMESQKQKDNKYIKFHGIRDYFSVVGHIVRQIGEMSDEKTAFKIIQEAYFRNFSGLSNSKELLQAQFEKINKEFSQITQLKPLELIDQNLRENSQNYICRNLMIVSKDERKSIQYLKQKLRYNQHKFFIGMNFSQEQQAQQVNDILNQIICCIEQGFIIVLLNLDYIYQSLYEVLNQSYHTYDEKYYSKISIGADNSVIEVNKNFKLILLVNEQYLNRMDGPLLNRFEKHYLNHDDIIDAKDRELIEQLIDQVNKLQENKKKEIQDKCKIKDQTYLNSLVSFKFKNLESIIQDLYLQHKLKTYSLNNSENSEMSQNDQEIILQKLFHLSHFSSILLPVSEQISENNLSRKQHQDYIESGYHFSLESFICNRISMQNQNLQNLASGEQCEVDQIRQFVVFSPNSSSNTFEPKCANYTYIDINEIESEQQFDKSINQFFSQLQEEKQQKTQSDQKQNIRFQQKLEIDSDQFNYEQKILIIDTCLSQIDCKGKQQIEFIMQKIDELSVHKNRNINIQLNIIIIVRVEDLYSMIPIIGNWEYYYIENLSPFSQYKCDGYNTQLMDDIKENLSLKNLINKRNLWVNSFLNLQALIEFYFRFDFQLIEEAYSKINYESESAQKLYRQKRLTQLIEIFDRGSHYRNELEQIIKSKFFAVIKNTYNIDTLDSFILQYLVPQHFIDKSNSIINCILLGIKNIFVQFFYKIIYRIELNGLIYGMHTCKEELFQELVYSEMRNAIQNSEDNFQVVKENFLKPTNDLIIKESIEILKIIQKFENSIKKQQKKCRIENDEILSIYCESASKHLQDYQRQVIKYFRYILIDSQNLKINYIKEQYLEIIENLLFAYQSNLNNETQQHYLVNIYLVWYIWRQQIKDISKLIESYKKYINIKQILQKFQQDSRKIKVSELTKELNILLIKKIYDSIEPKQSQNESIQYEKISFQLLNTLKKCEDNQCQQILGKVQLINYICHYFSEINEISKLLCQINIQDLISLQKDSLQTAKALLKSQFINSLEFQNKQKNVKNQFLKKWNQLMKKLVILSIENGKIVKVDHHFIHLIFKLEKREAKLVINNDMEKQYDMVQNTDFQILLHRVFFLLKSTFTIDNQHELFLNCDTLFSQSIQEQKSEYYTFLAYGQILQNFYKNIFQDKSSKEFNFLKKILLNNKFEELNNLQQTIYMSIFKALVEQLVDSKNLEKRYFYNQLDLDVSILKYFSELNNKGLQLYIVKQLFYKQKLKLIQNSYFFKNCKWLYEYQQFQNLNKKQLIQLNSLMLSQDEDVIVDYLKKILLTKIKLSKNIFYKIYYGLIDNNLYYPFNMRYSFESDVDSQLNQKLYQCLSCENFIVLSNDKCIVKCKYCKDQININQNIKLKLVLKDISKIEDTQSEIKAQKGFCLKISKKQVNSQINLNSCCQALFSLLYHIIFSLSLQYCKDSNFGELSEISLLDTSQQKKKKLQTQNINKILKIHPTTRKEDYLNKQIRRSLSCFFKYTCQKYKITQSQSLYTIVHLVEYLLKSDIEGKNNISDILSLNQKLCEDINVQLNTLENEYYNNKIFLVLEKYNILYNNIEDKIQFLPKSLKYTNKYINYQKAYKYINNQVTREGFQIEFPILIKLLDIVQNQKLLDGLKVFVKYYKNCLKLFSFQFKYSEAQSISLNQAINRVKGQILEKNNFIESWNEMLNIEHNNKKIKEILNINSIDGETKLIDLIYTSQHIPSQFFIYLNYLCNYQNKLINEMLDTCQRHYNNKNVKKLDQEIRFQFQNQEESITKPLQSISSSQIIYLKNYQIFEQFVSWGFEEEEGINKLFIFCKKGLQHELAKVIFLNARLIDIQNSVQIQFLHFSEEMIGQNNEFNYFQELAEDQIKCLNQIINNNKEVAFDALIKISTTQKQNCIDINEQHDTPICQTIKLLKIKFQCPKLAQYIENFQLKDLPRLKIYLQEKILDRLVQQCNQDIRDDCQSEYIEALLLKFQLKLDFLKDLRKIVGFYIIKMFFHSSKNVKSSYQLSSSLQEEGFINEDNNLFQDQGLSKLTIKDCFILFEKVELLLINNKTNNQDFDSEKKQNVKLLIEDFDESIESLNQKI
ncbi:hypothetical protein ABPG72_017261 [Tetrahymena utriculariae]